MTSDRKQAQGKLATNRKALRDYFILERCEAGIELRGTEVKSVKAGELSLGGAHARVRGSEIWLHDLNIQSYAFGNRFNHDPDRPRRLLLHRKEIDRLRAQTEQKRHTLIPLSFYLKRGLVKVELGLCKGKQQRDKREDLKRRTAARDADRVMALRQRNAVRR